MGDKIIFYGQGGNIYYQELIGQNIKIQQSKMVRLFNYSPRWCGNMQSFKYAKSLVQLDAYSRGGVFQRPKRREGWKLKKWENWMLELCALEKLWRRIYELERSISVKWLRLSLSRYVSLLLKKNAKLPIFLTGKRTSYGHEHQSALAASTREGRRGTFHQLICLIIYFATLYYDWNCLARECRVDSTGWSRSG